MWGGGGQVAVSATGEPAGPATTAAWATSSTRRPPAPGAASRLRCVGAEVASLGHPGLSTARASGVSLVVSDAGRVLKCFRCVCACAVASVVSALCTLTD